MQFQGAKIDNYICREFQNCTTPACPQTTIASTTVNSTTAGDITTVPITVAPVPTTTQSTTTTTLRTRQRETVCEVFTNACAHDPKSECAPTSLNDNGYECNCMGAYTKNDDGLCKRCQLGYVPLDNECVLRRTSSQITYSSFMFSISYFIVYLIMF